MTAAGRAFGTLEYYSSVLYQVRFAQEFNIESIYLEEYAVKASVSDQRSILDIQKFDLQSATLRNKAATLPELAELSSTTIKQNNVRDLRIAAETELSDVKRELARAEGDVEQIVTRIERD